MDHDETGCQTPEVPILCINNCGFFGSAATMNMCSKCYRDFVLEQEQVQFAASSIDDIINQNAKRTTGKEEPSVIVTDYVPDVAVAEPDKKVISTDSANDVSGSNNANGNDVKMRNEGPKRCKACSKRVGLTGFNCRCGDLFCALHRYSDKHNCPFDYRMAAQEAIAKANPIVKTEKLDRI